MKTVTFACAVIAVLLLAEMLSEFAGHCSCYVESLQILVICQFGWIVPMLTYFSGDVIGAARSSTYLALKMSQICSSKYWK